MLERGIDQIDILKIDVEGAENRVLKGFCARFSDRRITLIQFMYGHRNIFSHFLLLNFCCLLRDMGFHPRQGPCRWCRIQSGRTRAGTFLDQSRDIIDAVRSKRGLALTPYSTQSESWSAAGPGRFRNCPRAARVKKQCQERQGITSGKPIHNMEM
jgi:hypothetical protein